MKKLIALFLCVMTVTSLAACGNTGKSANTLTEQPNSSTSASQTTLEGDGIKEQIADPFQDCDTLEDAAKICGFDMTVPADIDGYSRDTIQAVENEMFQISYVKDNDSLMIRKAVGSDDFSGDYNEYDTTNAVTVGKYQVTTKGNDGMVSVAIWTDSGYSYAVDVSGIGLSAEDMTSLIESIH